MSAGRVDMHRLQDLVRLHRLGHSTREISRLLRMGRNAVRDYRDALKEGNLLDGDPDVLPDLEVLRAVVLQHAPGKPARQQLSSIEPLKDRIDAMAKKGAGPQAIYDALRLEPDFKGSLSAVKRLCLRLKRERGVQPQDVAIPVETAPGEVAQVDFGYVGKLYDPKAGILRKTWVFVMVLGFSRKMVARLVFDQRAETWQRLHIEAFNELGGVVGTVVPDNLKAAVIRAAFGADREPGDLNRSYRELARHYHFKVDPTPPADPPKKGKVESGVKYVKNNFFTPRELMDIDQARKELDLWVREVANQRIHGSTGRRPDEVFEQRERSALQPLPLARFEPVTWKQATVHQDSHVVFERRLFSVPWKLIGQKVWIRASASTVAIYHQDTRVATHERRGPGNRSTQEAHLPEHRAALRHRSQAYWQGRADSLGPEMGQYVREFFGSDDVLSQLRAVQAVVTYLEGHPVERARAACLRASHFGAYSYQAIKNILKKGLDKEPLPQVLTFPAAEQPTPRFARKPGDICPLFGETP